MIKCIMSTELLLATLKLIKNNLQPRTDGLNVFLDSRVIEMTNFTFD